MAENEQPAQVVGVLTETARETMDLVHALRQEGAEVQVIVHYAERQPPAERYETIEIGDAKWRQTLQLPCSLSLEERNKYIRDRAVGAAQAYSDALATANGPCTEAKANKPAKGA